MKKQLNRSGFYSNIVAMRDVGMSNSKSPDGEAQERKVQVPLHTPGFDGKRHTHSTHCRNTRRLSAGGYHLPLPHQSIVTGRALAGRYRLTKPTIALYPDGLKRICITVAEGAVVEVLAPVSAKTNELIEVKWQERTLSMFKEDIEERGVLTCVDPTSAGNALEDQITGQSWSPPR